MYEELDPALARRLETISRDMERLRTQGIEINACGLGAEDAIRIYLTKLEPSWILTLSESYGHDITFLQGGPFILARG